MKAKLLSALSMIAALLAAPAGAADLRRAPVKAPPPVPPPYVHNWTGFYFGGHIGGGWSDRCLTTEFGEHACSDASGWLGGGQVGWNFQTGQVVFGIEFSGSWSDIGGGNNQGSLPAGWAFSSDGKTLLMLTGRLGYAVDRSLFYIVGGGAWARNSAEVIAPGPVVATVDFDRQGWTIGAGFEYAFTPNWSLAAQYNYVDLGSKDVYFALVDTFGSVSQDVHIATLRLNYRFGWGAPVAARY
jgi:outer membrane immunogenic protein